MKKLSSILKNFDYQKNKWNIIAFFSLLFLGFYLYSIYLSNLNIPLKTRILILYLPYLCIFLFFFFKHKMKSLKEEQIFIALGIVIGSLYAIFIPALKGTDEASHFYRAYQIAEGNLITQNNDLTVPKNIVQIGEASIKNMPQNFFEQVSKDRVIPEKGIASYPYLQYIPQVCAIIICKLLHLGPFFMVYLARFANLFTFLFLAYQAIKIIPKKKKFTTFFLLSPAILSLAATASGDIFSIGIGFYFLATFLKCYDKKELLLKDEIIFLLLGVVLGAFKSIYVLLTLVLFLLPKECFTSKKQKIQTVLVLLAPAFFTSFWIFVEKYFIQGINSKEIQAFLINYQKNYVRSNPIRFLMIIFHTFFKNFFQFLGNFVAGNEMCYGAAQITPIFILGYFLFLWVSYFIEAKNYSFKKQEKYFIGFLLLITFLALNYVMYTSWTPIAAGGGIEYPMVLGVQARYFWLYFFLIPIFNIKNIKVNKVFTKKNVLWNLCFYLNIAIFLETFTSCYYFWFIF